MCKIKTKKSASKRFIKLKNGSIKHRRSNRAHLNIKSTSRKILSLRKNTLISSNDKSNIKKQLPY